MSASVTTSFRFADSHLGDPVSREPRVARQWTMTILIPRCVPQGTTNPLPPHVTVDAKTLPCSQSCHQWATCECCCRTVTSMHTFRCLRLPQYYWASKKKFQNVLSPFPASRRWWSVTDDPANETMFCVLKWYAC